MKKKLQDPNKKIHGGKAISNGECVNQPEFLKSKSTPATIGPAKVSWSGYCTKKSSSSSAIKSWWAITLMVLGGLALVGTITYFIYKNQKKPLKNVGCFKV